MWRRRLPGLESSKNNLLEEDEMYNEMMASVLEITFLPYLSPKLQEKVNINYGFWDEIALTNAESQEDITETCRPEYERDTEPLVEEKHATRSYRSATEDDKVGPTESASDSNAGSRNFRNLFRWKSYTMKRRLQVLAIYN